MKVAIDSFGIRDGGGVRLLETLTEHLSLARPDWEWVVYLEPELREKLSEECLTSNVEWVLINLKGGWLSRLYWLNIELLKRVRQDKADVLFCFSNLCPRRRSIPCVLFVQQMKLFVSSKGALPRKRMRLLVMNRYFRWSASSAERIIVQNSQMAELISQCCPSLGERVSVIPSPVKRFKDLGDDDHLPIKLGAGSRIIYVSVARDHKNHLLLIRAFALLRECIPGVSLLLTVSAPGSVKTSPLAKNLHNEAARLGVSEAISWLGEVDYAELISLYRSADLMVFPSLLESFGLPLAEAICEGLPVIASDLPFAHEILAEAGEYFDPCRESEIARVVFEVISNEGRISEMRELARARGALFAPERIVEQLCDQFEEVARGIN